MERRALERVRRGVQALVDVVTAQLGRAQSRISALLVVRRARPALVAALERELVAARREARAASRESAGAPASRGSHDRDEEDETAANAAAHSYAAAWVAAALAFLLGARDEPADARELSTLDARIVRIVVTEVARGFNDERHRIAGALPAADWLMVWNALLDARTCVHCRRRHGEVRALDAPFRPMPPAHPNCRCVVELIHRDDLVAAA